MRPHETIKAARDNLQGLAILISGEIESLEEMIRKECSE